MDQSRWDKAASLFLDALDVEPDARAAWVIQACQGDEALRLEVAAMLAAHHSTDGLRIEHRLLAQAAGPESLASLAPGTMLGHYRIESLVGEGGMGEVYRAERMDGEYRQTVAVKLLRPGLLTADTVRRFRTERQVLARLVHPDIAPILDGGTAPDGRPFLVLQFVDGEPITDYCTHHRLDLVARLRLFQRVAEAVQYAHGHLVVHRDIKPSNILVQQDGAPRLLDFGIAKLLDREFTPSPFAVTQPELRLLTPEHAAPEQLRGDPIGTATDVYGLGVLLFELLAGRRPFPSAGRTTSELVQAILEEPPPPPSTIGTGGTGGRRLRGDLDRIVLMALRKEPDRRYRSAGDLAEDVHRFLQGLPVRAQRDTIGYRTRKFIGRNAASVAGAALLLLSISAVAVTSAVQARTVARERDRAELERAAAEDVASVLIALFERSNPLLVPGGDTLRIGALVDEAEAQVNRLSGQPTRQLRLLRAVGRLRMARGEHERARGLLEEARTRIAADPNASATEQAGLYHELAMAVRATLGSDSARPLLDSSLARHLALLGPDHRDLAIVYTDRAFAEPDPTERRRLLAEARRIRERGGSTNTIELAQQLNAEGNARFVEGRWEEALHRFEAAGDLLAEIQPPGHGNRLTMASSAASALLSLGRWQAAESVLVEVRAQETASINPLQRATTLERLGLVLANQGRHDEAEALLRESLAISRASGPQRLANTFRNLGVVLAARGAHDEGLALLDSAIVLERKRNSDGINLAFLNGQRSLLLLAQGHSGSAAALAGASATRIREALPVNNLRRSEAEVWVGLIALEQGDAQLAEARFAAAVAGSRFSLPPSHPKLAMARCGLAVARVRLGLLEAARAELPSNCRIHAAWGLAQPTLVAAAKEAAATLDVQFR